MRMRLSSIMADFCDSCKEVHDGKLCFFLPISRCMIMVCYVLAP